MTCKDCVCFEVCDKKFQYMFIGSPFRMSNYMYGVEERCKEFKDKSQFVEVVRCKDCEHYHKGKESTVCDYDYCDILYYCDGSHRTACEQDYCSYGKRKTE